MPDFLPTASLENLRLRAYLLRRLREFFHDRGFLEVETPILSADTVVDRHLDPFCTEIPSGPGRPPRRLWLQTSPEFAMKRLLAAGTQAIYQVTRAFRLGEQGPLHNPEFTMVEWYRAGDGPADGMQLTSDLCEVMLARGPAERISYRAAFQQHVGLDPHTTEPAALIAAARDHGIAAPASLAPDDRDGWLDLLLAECVQPHLGLSQPGEKGDCPPSRERRERYLEQMGTVPFFPLTRPVLLYDYPASQAALARIRAEEPPVAERFELYVDGIELANGYHELLDAAELRQRTARASAQRRAEGKRALPEQSRLLSAMQAGLPPAVGVALGFDRLAMLAAGAKTLAEVMAFPLDRA